MHIRPALSSDVEAIARTHVLGWQHAYAEIFPPDFLASLSVEQRARMWAEAIEKQIQRLLVIEVAGQVAGFAAFGPCRDDGAHATDFEVWAIYLLPQFIGCGAGRALWLGCLAQMKSAGATRITLWVLAENARAIRFYRAAGFTEDAGSRKSIQRGGVLADEVRYEQVMTRILIEPRLPIHAAELFPIMSDPLLYEHVDVAHRPGSEQSLRERFERNSTNKSPDGSQDWLAWVIRNEAQRIVGYLTATIHPDGDAHIAYGVGSHFWGRGYARSATDQLLALLSESSAAKRFCIVTERENGRSVQLAKSLGFVEEKSEVERRKNSLSESEVLLHKLVAK